MQRLTCFFFVIVGGRSLYTPVGSDREPKSVVVVRTYCYSVSADNRVSGLMFCVLLYVDTLWSTKFYYEPRADLQR